MLGGKEQTPSQMGDSAKKGTLEPIDPMKLRSMRNNSLKPIPGATNTQRVNPYG